MNNGVVLFFQSSRRYWWQRLRGVYNCAERFGWRVHVVEDVQLKIPIRRLLDFWKPAGCIVEGGLDSFQISPKDMRSVPVVFCDVSPSVFAGQKGLFVKHDSRATAIAAFQDLAKLEWNDFAFVGFYSHVYWSGERELAFRGCVRSLGKSYHLFDPANEQGFSNIVEYQKKLRMWLKELPKPCALLAANDYMAQTVLDACHALDINVPEQIAVVGIDNDDLICEMAKPTLTSVQPDFERAGYMSVDLLAERIANPALSDVCRSFGPLGVIRRGSTGVLAVRNKLVAYALELIRKEAVHGLKAIDVINRMGCGRRKAEKAFREATGHSILEKIEEVRIDAVYRYLMDPRMKITAIADSCGYDNGSYLRRHFRKITGQSMSEWRCEYLASACRKSTDNCGANGTICV